jgi:hypothetical protein
VLPSPYLTPIIKYPIHITMHPLQPRFEEVVIQVRSLANPTLRIENGTSFSHVINMLDPSPSERERFILPMSTLSPSPDEVPFN